MKPACILSTGCIQKRFISCDIQVTECTQNVSTQGNQTVSLPLFSALYCASLTASITYSTSCIAVLLSVRAGVVACVWLTTRTHIWSPKGPKLPAQHHTNIPQSTTQSRTQSILRLCSPSPTQRDLTLKGSSPLTQWDVEGVGTGEKTP